MSANKLRLGPLPKSEPVKLTVTLSAELKATLDRYAALHSQTLVSKRMLQHSCRTCLRRSWRGTGASSEAGAMPRSALQSPGCRRVP